MRITDSPGIYHMVEDISVEAMRAQRQAELKDIAEWRSRRIQAYKDWSDPEKRAARIAEAKHQEQIAREMMDRRTVYLPAWRRLGDMVKMTPVRNPKLTWWQRLLRHMFG